MHMNCHPRDGNLIVYASGRFIVVRDLENPSNTFVYRGHNANTTVAKFSPSGMYVASGDVTGKVRVWSWTHKEKLLKTEVQAFSGPVRDIDWDFENKKICAAGEGSGILCKVFDFDSGKTWGEMTGHMKPVLSCAYKPKRPFRVATCSEDFKVCFFAGPPFKLDHSEAVHSNFVNCLRYSADGAIFVTCGTDKKVQFFDGAAGTPIHAIENAHSGSIYSVSFSPDGSKIATVSADKTLKVWNAGDGSAVQEVKLPNCEVLGGMLVSVLWTNKNQIVALSLDGTLWVMDCDGDSIGEAKAVYGHQGAITASTVAACEAPVLYTGSFDGAVMSTVLDGSSYTRVKFPGTDKRSTTGGLHANKVVGLSVPFADDANALVTAGWDNCIKSTNQTSLASDTTDLTGQPRGLAVSRTSSSALSAQGGFCATATAKEVVLMQGPSFDKVASATGLAFQPTCLAMHADEAGNVEIFVGGADNKTHVFTKDTSGMPLLAETATLETRSAISAVASSPDGNFLAVGESGRQIEIFRRGDGGKWDSFIKGKWVFHVSRVTCLAFSPSGDRLVSGSTDESLFVWRVSQPSARVELKFAHNTGVTTAAWTSEDTIVSTGSDGVIVTWKVPDDAA